MVLMKGWGQTHETKLTYKRLIFFKSKIFAMIRLEPQLMIHAPLRHGLMSALFI